ncbi:MAG TPA: alanine--tRNA ligase [Acidimicrobiales bacterium]|nr:alanine--tRNA ligase [Acidimicrobiales bacterium]
MDATASALRKAFVDFFVERGHTHVPSSSLIPHDKTVLFTVAGMVQFKPYFLGDEAAPFPRATTVQKCFRTLDIDIIGTTARHCTFFEMLGNFSFGDYFKEGALPFAWELVTEVLGFHPDRLWVTVHESDDEAADMWLRLVGVPQERIQRLGDEDNWWAMGDKYGPGPCGPCSEIYYDLGPDYGPDGGPLHGGEDRFVEIWNLVFMQYNRMPDKSLVELPKKNIDTGAGFERILPILQGGYSVFETELMRPMVAAAEGITGRRYGDDERTDISLRIMGDHARAMSFLVSDGVFPSNEDRGYVLRRIIRRAVRHAFQLGVDKLVTPTLVDATVDTLGEAWPELSRNHDFVLDVVTREEERFRQTLKSGSAILDEEIAKARRVSGEAAFRLHDTFGFPIELTKEIAEERGVEVDLPGFEDSMQEQRRRAKEDRKAAGGGNDVAVELYRDIVEEFGTTEFTGYAEHESKARVLAVIPNGDQVEVFLDRTPFYAEGGGQVGDTGTVTTPTGTARVLDTTYALPGLHRHTAELIEGEITAGQEATACIDTERRESIRRNHTGTHLLHWALREVLGSHVKQQGSLVAPDYLRFDFSHHSPVSDDDLAQIEHMVNQRILANEPVRSYETSKEQAEQLGAIAFFGDKYGDFVRIVEAGTRSMELCGGTHVGALGMIGPVKVLSESSIGSNMRRIFALTGEATLEHFRQEERLIEQAADLLRAKPEELPDAVLRTIQRQKSLEDELKALRAQVAKAESGALAADAVDGCVVLRRDGLAQDQLRDLALAIREQPGVRAVVLVGTPDGERVALVAATAKDSGLQAGPLLAEAAKAVGGGGGGKGDVAVAGGKDVSGIDRALEVVRSALGIG